MRNAMKYLLGALWLTLGTSLAAAADDADGKPDVYEISDGDSSIYLFGTFHALPADLEWQKPALDDVIAKSSRFFMELDNDDPQFLQKVQAAMVPLMQAQAGQGNLQDELSPESFQKMAELLSRAGIPAQQAAVFPPWFITLQLAQIIIAREGFNPQLGAEARLVEKIRAAGGDIEGLETPEIQFAAISGGTRAEQVKLLQSTLDDLDEVSTILEKMTTAWSQDDGAAFSTLFADSYADSPALEEALLGDRNRAWMAPLVALLERNETSFIAVGAGHLYGDDGLLALMSARGYTIQRH